MSPGGWGFLILTAVLFVLACALGYAERQR